MIFKTVANISLVLIVLGCGTMFDSGGNSKEKITIPKETSIQMPKILKKDTKNSISEGYKRLKDNIEDVELSQKISKIYRLLAEQIIEEVESSCQEIAIDKKCIIEADKLSIVFDDKFMRNFKNIIDEEPSSAILELKDKPMLLGEVEFTEYNTTQIYHYDLKMNTSQITQAFGIDKNSTQSIKWSKDERDVFTFISDESNRTETSTSVTYHKNEDGSKEMSINGYYNSKIGIDVARFQLDLIEKNDNNDSFEISTKFESREHYEEEMYESNGSSIGEISTLGGYLSIWEVSMDIRRREYYLFDGNGTVISDEECVENIEEDICLDL